MKKRKFAMIVGTALLTLATTITVFAGSWKQDNVGWWYQRDNGSYPANGWEWIDGNKDGTSECYYFNSKGYCLLNSTTPDGYQVDENGAWIVGTEIQTKKTEVQTQTSQNTIADGRQMYFNHPKWTKEEVLSIQTLDAFNRKFCGGEYWPRNVEITSQASSDKYAYFLDREYNYANYLSSAYAYGLEKDIYMNVSLSKFTGHSLGSVAKSIEIYEASKDLYQWKSFDDFYIYHMMLYTQKAPFKNSIYAMSDSAWKKLLEDMVDNIARWEGQTVPDIFLLHDGGMDYSLLYPEAVYHTYEELLDYYLKEGSIVSKMYYDGLKKYEGDGYRWVEPTQFFKIRYGWVYTPDDSLVDSWLEAMKPAIREKYGVELSWHPPYGPYAAYLIIELTPIK